MIKLIFLSFFALSLFSFTSDKSDNTGEISALKSKDGVVILYNSVPSDSTKPDNGTSFMFNVRCKEFRDIESENMMFLADQIIFQFIPVPISAVSKHQQGTELNDTLLLLLHQYNELRYIREKIPGDYEINDKLFMSASGRLCLQWEFDKPLTEKDTAENVIIKEYYLTTKLNDKIIFFSSAIQRKNNQDSVKLLILHAVNTIQSKVGSYSTKTISDSLKTLD